MCVARSALDHFTHGEDALESFSTIKRILPRFLAQGLVLNVGIKSWDVVAMNLTTDKEFYFPARLIQIFHGSMFFYLKK